MKIPSIKKDWWLANSIFLFVSAILIVLSGIESGNFTRVVLIGGIEALLALALLQRSKIVFWMVFVITSYRTVEYFVGAIPNYRFDFYSLPFVIIVVKFAFVLMLWQQIRRESNKSKI